MEPLYYGLKPTQDIVFQYVFSSAGCEPGLLGFINAVRESEGFPRVQAVQVKNPFNVRQSFDDKMSILDIRVVDDRDQTYDIEMQTAKEEFFEKRVMYYWSRIYGSQMQLGESYAKLQPVVSIILTEFVLFPELSDLHNVFSVSARKNPSVPFSDQLAIHLLELAKPKLSRLPECSRHLRNWLEFLKNGNTRTEEEMEDLLQNEPGLDVAYHKFREFSQDEQLRDLVLRQKMAESDRVTALEYAEKRGLAKGMQKGRQEGLQEGRQEGLQEGIVSERAAKVIQFLKRRFPYELSQEIESKLLAITNADLLDTLFWEAAEAETIQDITKYL